jgi:excisionase family DNA binding protein
MERQILISLTPEELKTIVSEAVRSELSSLASKTGTHNTKLEFLSRKETASLLGVSLVTLNTWVKDGKINAHRIGSSVRFKSDEIVSSLKKIKHQ